MENYEKIANGIINIYKGIENKKRVDFDIMVASMTSFIKDLKKDDKEFDNDFLEKISKEIDEFEKVILMDQKYLSSSKITAENIKVPDSKKIKKDSTFKKSNKIIKGVCLGALLVSLACNIYSCEKIESLTGIIAENEEETEAEIETVVEVEVEEALSDLAFDPNSNEEVIERMTSFVENLLESGLAVEDCMTEEEIDAAKENGVITVTVSELMDYYFVMNIEDIDVADYAALGYENKTTETIMESYKNVATGIATQALAAKDINNTIILNEIIADKDSGDILQTVYNSCVLYNSTDEEIEKEAIVADLNKFINTYFIIGNESDIHSAVAEQAYRIMFSFDQLTNGLGISKDLNIILNEDATYSCGNVGSEENVTLEEGIKNESERAQDYTNLSSKIEEKLILINNVSEGTLSEQEQLSGYAIEYAIIEGVDAKFGMLLYVQEGLAEVKASVKKHAEDPKVQEFTTEDGEKVNVSNTELENHGVSPTDPNAQASYEATVVAEDVPTIVVKDETETVISSGVVDFDPEAAYKEGYSEGNTGAVNAPSSSISGYVASYNQGYSDGAAAKAIVDAATQDTNTIENTEDVLINQQEGDVIDVSSIDDLYELKEELMVMFPSVTFQV